VIPFQLVNGLTVIQAEIDGISGSYLLDTGSDGIILDGTVDNNSESKVISLGGTSTTNILPLKEIKVGDYRQTNLEAQVISLKHIKDHLGIELKGIIGGYLFQPKVVIVDYKQSIITLADKFTKTEQKKFEHKVNINAINQIPIANIKIEDKWYKFALDSGSSIHFVDPKVLDELEGVSDTDQATKMTCLANNTNEQIHKQRIASFTFGGVDYADHICVPRSFEGVNASTGLRLDGILSLSKLVQESVVIDYTRSRLYF